MPRIVLVTGATGQVARGVLPHLGAEFDLRLLAPDVTGGDPRHVRGDILDLAGLTAAAAGADAVLHLAVATGRSGTYEDDAFNDVRFDVNVKGTQHVFEAARRAGVGRVVHVSSAMVTWGHARAAYAAGGGGKVPGDAPPDPVGTYALTKALGEQIACWYAKQYGMEVIVVRITAPLEIHEEMGRRTVRPQQIPFPDLAQAFRLAMTVPLAGYAVTTVAGHSSRCLWDLGSARRVLGYDPQYDLDALGVDFEEPFAVRQE